MENKSILGPKSNVGAVSKKIAGLTGKWEHHAKRLIWDAPNDKSMITATQAMEHGAIIYINCIRELGEVFGIKEEDMRKRLRGEM